jgi:hypothetical protein
MCHSLCDIRFGKLSGGLVERLYRAHVHGQSTICLPICMIDRNRDGLCQPPTFDNVLVLGATIGRPIDELGPGIRGNRSRLLDPGPNLNIGDHPASGGSAETTARQKFSFNL